MKAKAPPKPRIPEPRKRPSVIVLEDYTDADMTVQRAPLNASDLPQFDLEPICDPVDVRGDSVSGVVLADVTDVRSAPLSVPPMAMESSADASAEHFERKLRSGAWRFRAGVAAAVALAAVSLWVGMKNREPLAAHVPVALETPAPVTASPISEDALAAVIDDMNAKTGLMIVDAAPGRAVLVDGAVIGEAPGPVRASCGEHVVQVGLNGALRNVTIPCGGEVSIR